LDLIRRVKCFGLALVKLDIRQESERHTEALDAISSFLGLGSYAAWSEAERQVQSAMWTAFRVSCTVVYANEHCR